MDSSLTIDQALSMQKPTDKFLVKLSDNVHGVRFNGFKLRDMDTGEIYHEYYPSDIYELDYFADHILDYSFSNKILKAKKLGSTLKLCIGDKDVKQLVIIERHYINGKIAANYSSPKYPLLFKNSENSVEFIYDMPKLPEETVKDIENGKPVKANSDTFVFVQGKLIIHRRAKYVYHA